MSSRLDALNEASGGATARTDEFAAKQQRLTQWLQTHNYAGIVIRRHENLAWATAGQIEARVGALREAAVISLLVTREGRWYAIAGNNEAPRMIDEELQGLAIEPVARPWHSLDPVAEATALAGEALASDTHLPGCTFVDLGGLRTPLLAPEVARFRALGRATGRTVSEILLSLEPGVSEYEMEARVSEQLLRANIFPSVLLMAVDDRILQYKHAVARGRTLERFGMLNLCARRWGLAVSITRFVHFGPMPAELANGFKAAAQVNAALQHATRAGATGGFLFETAAKAYAAAGYPGEEQLHHQGGAAGYLEREWVATPGGHEQVREPEAYAWNPSCRGGKVEDTTLLIDGHIEVLTQTPDLPEVHTSAGGVQYTSTAPLIRD